MYDRPTDEIMDFIRSNYPLLGPPSKRGGMHINKRPTSLAHPQKEGGCI
jgi:hypothetical protein